MTKKVIRIYWAILILGFMFLQFSFPYHVTASVIFGSDLDDTTATANVINIGDTVIMDP